MVKHLLQCRRPQFDSCVRKIHWRRDRLPTPVFLSFPGGSAGKESTCNVGDLGSIPGLGRFLWRRERLPIPVFWPGEFHGLYSPWSRKESNMTACLSYCTFFGALWNTLYAVCNVNRCEWRCPRCFTGNAAA